MVFYGRVRELTQLLANGDQSVELDVAALQVARIEFGDVPVGPFLEILDSYATELGQRLSGREDGPAWIRAANEYLFEELGFHGNQVDYYNPRNSCLNEVLTGRTGIPITLCIVYMEIARRHGRSICGIGLPGHFVVRYDDGDYAAYLDPFHGGRVLTEKECLELSRVSGLDVSANASRLLAPNSKRQMMLRMLYNLRAIYFRQQAWTKSIQVLDLLVEARPKAAEEYKQRATAHLQLRRTRAALADFEKYLALAPKAEDRAAVARQVQVLRGWLASLN